MHMNDWISATLRLFRDMAVRHCLGAISETQVEEPEGDTSEGAAMLFCRPGSEWRADTISCDIGSQGVNARADASTPSAGP